LAGYYYTVLLAWDTERQPNSWLTVVTTEDNDRRTARDLAKGSDRSIKALNSEEPDFYIYKNRIILL
jgi:hypothetical protein